MNTNFKIALYKKFKKNTTTREEIPRLILKNYIKYSFNGFAIECTPEVLLVLIKVRRIPEP